ncbi:uncharacterized protein L969DRAFT_84100 [Mixia osmundae IAM 14324]|uniref:Uncharacterized protein n=1 Tax=Mixia osmundae (strain CBS 9802 / IAM 14324 / JCM 22182 / KY 12970) TaxID=764103 RepID=G7E088_MIXOS|nr:uncharacterized protein L969DRAFT_84100 [Mixia osmundae IAM 14324]KEI42238.1 hypothetical protein L969DRAFT_84100 [Mixia osmundae IAM 14324]GAA96248.1 hypothetical protein E5Q_02912 [Mixia osmundae IAM 14324]
MQRRTAGGVSRDTGARSPPILQHPRPTLPASAYAIQNPASPPLSVTSSPPKSSRPSHEIAGNASTGFGSASHAGQEYMRFSSPPVSTPVSLNPAAAAVDPYATYAAAANQHAGPSSFGSAGQQSQQQSQQWRPPNGAQSAQQTGGPQQQWNNMMGVNDVTAQMGMQFGKSAVMAGQDYMERNVTRYIPVAHLHHSFNVSNLYVLHKIRLVLFPWRHKPWSRLVKRSEASGQAEGYRPPREDVNSPDLYVPVMALVTYILLSGVVAGSESRFHPELLGVTASKSLGIVFLEFLVIKLGCYLLNIGGEGTVVDLLAYSGYKFVGIIITLLAGLVKLRGWMYWSIFIYVFSANAFFLLRSLRYVVLPDPSLAATFGGATTTSTVGHAQRSRRIQFLFGIAVSQIATMWLLVRV